MTNPVQRRIDREYGRTRKGRAPKKGSENRRLGPVYTGMGMEFKEMKKNFPKRLRDRLCDFTKYEIVLHSTKGWRIKSVPV